MHADADIAAPLRVWLDDDLVDRAAPHGWRHVTTAQEAIDLLDTGAVVELSLDHDRTEVPVEKLFDVAGTSGLDIDIGLTDVEGRLIALDGKRDLGRDAKPSCGLYEAEAKATAACE